MLIGSLVLHGVGKVGYGWVQRDMIMGWGKVGYMGLGKDEDMMVNPCLPITAALRSLSPPGSVGEAASDVRRRDEPGRDVMDGEE